MAKKPDGLVADRPVLSIRPQSDLKKRLEEAAEESGRSLAREAEVRLEASFETNSASKLERYIQNRPGLSYMIGMKTPLELTNQLGDVLLSIVRHCEEQNWNEIQTREALSAGANTVSFYYFWRGQGEPPVPDVRPIPPANTKIRDLPPALAGYVIAESQLLFSSNLQHHDTFYCSYGQQIANVWSGDGKTVEDFRDRVPVPKAKKRRGSAGLIGEEEAGRLHDAGVYESAPPVWHRVLSARAAEDATEE